MFDDFAVSLRMQDKSERTVFGYLHDLRLFADYSSNANRRGGGAVLRRSSAL